MHCGALSRERGSQVARNPAFGLLLGVALAGWALLVRPEAPGATTTAAAVLLALVGYALGATASRIHPALPGGAVAVAVPAAVAVTLPASLSGAATAPPLGYGNADAALLLAATAGLLVGACLLYTSDAADDLLCVDLGGRR